MGAEIRDGACYRPNDLVLWLLDGCPIPQLAPRPPYLADEGNGRNGESAIGAKSEPCRLRPLGPTADMHAVGPKMSADETYLQATRPASKIEQRASTGGNGHLSGALERRRHRELRFG